MDELPFNCQTDIEFLRETGAWIYQCTSALNSKDLFADVLADPNEVESCENEGISIESKYYDVKNTARILKTGNKGFSLLHCNTRSLSKNLPLLNDIYRLSVRTRTNIGKQTIASLASELWQELPTDLKNLSSNCFSKQVKQHLLHKQSHF